MLLKKIYLYFFTIKHLKFSQVYYRFYYKIKKHNSFSHSAKKIDVATWVWSTAPIFEQSLLENKSFYFLNELGEVKYSGDWNSDNHSKLWLYNLHYFNDLSSFNFSEREREHYYFINRWIEDNPPCYGNGWEPYPLSLRLVNWVKWFSNKREVEKKYLNSILNQALVLSKFPEYHILGNHLFANAKALIFVGCYLENDLSHKFLDLGLNILDKEIKVQFLNDGAHFELSPMYHGILLWDLLELIDLAKLSQNSKLQLYLDCWVNYAEKALKWLSSMVHPDGEISFFNDAAFGIAVTPKDIFDYANKLNIDFNESNDVLVTNDESGYSRVKLSKYNLIFDHANIGPDFLPGHAHADSLSFELSLGKSRLFVNSGTSLYGVSNERLRQRSTPAHNTVVVCEQNSSEVWSGFRVARRAYAKLLKAEQNASSVVLSASHDGYKRLKPKVVHTRTIEAKEAEIIITDSLSHHSEAIFNLHIHPDVVVELLDNKTLQLTCPANKVVILSSSQKLFVEKSTWHPEFGKSVENKKIIIPFNNGQLITKIEVIKE